MMALYIFMSTLRSRRSSVLTKPNYELAGLFKMLRDQHAVQKQREILFRLFVCIIHTKNCTVDYKMSIYIRLNQDLNSVLTFSCF